MLYDIDLYQKNCKIKFLELFSEDYTLPTALAKYKEDIRISCTGDEFTHIMADRNVVPDYFWVFHFHAQSMEKRYGIINGVDANQRAEQGIKNYNEKHGLELAKIAQTDEATVAICDLFSRRVHVKLPEAGDIILVDATSNLDRQDTKLVHIVCPSPAGGIPLGNIIVSREDEITLKAGFDLLPTGAFFRRGPNVGPKIAMTDDCQAEHLALSSTWDR